MIFMVKEFLYFILLKWKYWGRSHSQISLIWKCITLPRVSLYHNAGIVTVVKSVFNGS